MQWHGDSVPAANPAIRWPTEGLSFGCDYNPEQWPRETWHEDVALMRQAHVNLVTVGVFSWALLEPEPGSFEFGWLDDVLDLLHRHGIGVDLATATASPPPWMSRLHPETLPVTAEGVRLSHGSRQSWCPSAPAFRERALALVRALAERYGQHPALAMWHVSNELGCHNARCYCDLSAAAFRTWLMERYGDGAKGLTVLNEAWGTRFWSQTYSDWRDVLPPRATTTIPNPTQRLDFARFSSDALLEYYCAERDLLRELTPGIPVTTNFMVMRGFQMLDYARWAPEQDIVSQDHYIDHRLDRPDVELAMSADQTRGLAGPGPWLLMEHSTSAVNWQPVNVAKAPGGLSRASLAHLARGADGLAYFQWRASRAGAEKFHSALVPHVGTESKVWREVVQLGNILERLAGVRGTRVEASVAMLFDRQAQWASDLPSHPTDRISYGESFEATYDALWDLGITVDVVHPDADLAPYELLVVPSLYLVSDQSATAIEAAVARGAHLVVTFFSGIVDADDHIRLGGYPGAFRELLGVSTEEFFPLLEGEHVAVTTPDGIPVGQASAWTEACRTTTAEAVLVLGDGPIAGFAAVTRRSVGDALVWYVAADLDPPALKELLSDVVTSAGIAPPLATVPAGVEVVRRSAPDRSYVFAINHTAAAVEIPLSGRDHVSERTVDGTLRLDPGAVAVVEES